MTNLRFLFAFFVFTFSLMSAQWFPQQSGVSNRFRGVSAVDDSTVWASGTKGCVVRTTDGGSHWVSVSVPGADSLDFRDIHAVDVNTAYVLSIGTGISARIYKTVNGGSSWKEQFRNSDSKLFFDAFAFWDKTHGIAMTDESEGRIHFVATTEGEHWNDFIPRQLPPSLPGEGEFAASGTCIVTWRSRHIWVGTGSGPEARVFRSSDRGESWAVSSTPIRHGAQTKGIFSLTFADSLHGAIVGGDYQKEQEADSSAAFTTDGGATWTLSTNNPSGYRSCVVVVHGISPRLLVAVGPSGSDYSKDFGRTWTPLDTLGFHAITTAGHGAAWAVGEKGSVAKLSLSNPR
jgi:photosystem II stability/assembly factor-like uncharacterized protein